MAAKPGLARPPWARLAWLPIPALLLALIAVRAAFPAVAHDLPNLRLVVSFVFYTLVSLGTLFLVGRSFLATGSPGLLLLECGVILWSLAGTVGDAVYHGDPNINVTVFNTSILLAGVCHLSGIAITLRGNRRLRRPGCWLAAACALAGATLGLVTHATLAGWLPVFFVPGHGGTAVRWGVLGSAVTMFVLSAGLLYARQSGERVPFTLWYVRALLLLAVGLFGVMIQRELGSAVNWLARIAQWLGGIYLLLAAVAAVRASDLPLVPTADASRPPLYREAMAVVVVLFAAAVRLVFLQALGSNSPFVTFYPAVLLVAVYGGWRAGLLATLTSAALADHFWMLPQGMFSIGKPADWLALSVFAVSSVLITFVANEMRGAQARAREAETRIQIAMARQRDLEALRLSEEKFVKAFQGNTAAMAITRLRDGVFIDVNERWVAINGFARTEVVGHSSKDLNVWKNASDRDGYARELQLHGTIHNREFHFVRKGGEPWAGLVSSQISELDGEPIIITSLIDISERKRAEEALRAANLELAEADRRKNEFLAVLSHELRNPLAPIRNGIFILGHTPPGSERAHRALAVIDRQTAQMVRLVDDLLDVTRITRNKIQLKRQRLDLNDLVHSTVEDQRSLFDANGVALAFQPAPEPLWVDGDSSRLAQVVGNLLQNAAKFTRHGGRVAVSLSAEADPRRAVVRVEDNGVGMAADMLGRLFTPFVQAETTLDRSTGGLGLGLALVKGLVELHGGEVCATSAGVGQGSQFTVRLALAESAPVTAVIAAAEKQEEEVTPPA